MFGLGLAIIRKKPFLAGLLLGALCYKPQFGLVIPFALLAAGYWRSIAGASVSVIALCAASTALFGPDIWPAFMASLGPTTHIVLEQGNTGWYKIQSLFSLVRNVGGSIPHAYTIHFGMAACITAYTVYAWRKHGSTKHTNALLMCASLLVTPYAMDYDLTLLAPVLAFLAISAIKQGLAPYEGAVLCLAWVTPLLARILLEHSFLPLGLITLLLLFIHTAYRHTGDTGAT